MSPIAYQKNEQGVTEFFYESEYLDYLRTEGFGNILLSRKENIFTYLNVYTDIKIDVVWNTVIDGKMLTDEEIIHPPYLEPPLTSLDTLIIDFSI